MARPSYTRNAALRKGREQGRAECIAQLEALLEYYSEIIERTEPGFAVEIAQLRREGVRNALATIRVPDEELVVEEGEMG